MKTIGFVKKVFFIGLAFLSDFTNANSLNGIPLSCISINNQECKARPQVVNVNGDSLCFFHLVLKQVNAVAVVIILTIHVQKFVFLM